MSAKQNRRLARLWAWRLGLMAGAEDAATNIAESTQEMDTEETLEYLHSLRDPGKEDWDSGARNVYAHKIDPVPVGYADTYYEAYNVAADRVVGRQIRLTAKALAAEAES
jgi:hypothetical protein